MGLSDTLRRELIHCLQTLIQTPSVNGVNPERDVAEVIAAFATAHGLTVEVLAKDAARPNVLVRVGPAEGEASLLLVAHTDTVAPGAVEHWTHPPFSGTMMDGRLYGRGAIDNKGGLVAALAALLMLKASPLTRPVLLACVPDEEAGATGTLGVKHLDSLGKLSGRGAIYTYPGQAELVLGHRGVLRFRLVAHGQAVHSGSLAWQQGQGCNAVTGLAEIVLALEGVRFDDTATDLFAPYCTVVTPTVLRGGVGPSMVPDRAEAYIDVRLTPSVARETVEQTIARLVDGVVQRRPGRRVDIHPDVYLPPTVIPTDSPVVLAVQDAARRLLKRDPRLTVSGPANESYLLNGYGIPTCIFGPEGDGAHAADEYVVLDSIFAAAEVYADVARHLDQADQ